MTAKEPSQTCILQRARIEQGPHQGPPNGESSMGETNSLLASSEEWTSLLESSWFLLESQGGKKWVGSAWNITYDAFRLLQICLDFIKLLKLLFICTFLLDVQTAGKFSLCPSLGLLGKGKNILYQDFLVELSQLLRSQGTFSQPSSLCSCLFVTTDLRVMLPAPLNWPWSCLFLRVLRNCESSYFRHVHSEALGLISWCLI